MTMNEAKAKAATMAKAPGNNMKEKAKVEGEDDLAEGPETKDKTKFGGESADGKNKGIGYNLREGVGHNLAKAPANGKATKETRHISSLEKFMNLAEAPGDSLDIDFDGEHSEREYDGIGYGIDESDDLKKKLSRNFYFAPKAENQNAPGKEFIDSSLGKLSKAPTGKEQEELEQEEEGSKEDSK